jgi:hypothetical protein
MTITFIIVELVEERNLLSVAYKSWEKVLVFSSEVVASYIETQQPKAQEQLQQQQ